MAGTGQGQRMLPTEQSFLRRLGIVPLLAGYAALHALATACGYALIPPSLSQAVFWPAVGLLLAALVALPKRRWAVFVVVAIVVEAAVGALFDNVVNESTTLWSWRLFFPLTNALASVIGALWVLYVLGWPPNANLRALALSVIGAAVASAAGAVAGTFGVTQLADQPRNLTFQLWWASNLLGIVAVAPAVLGLLVRPARELVAYGRAEAVGLWVSGVFLTLLVFGHDGGYVLWQAPYVLFPVFVWAGMRFPPLHVALLGLAFAIVASVMTLAGEGPFAADAADTLAAVTPLQYFLVVTLVTALGLARAIDDHRQTTAALDDTGRALQRTARDLVGAEEAARRTIAQDLHDGLAQLIAGLRLLLAPLISDPARPDSAEILERARTILSEAETQTRDLLADLNPPGLYDIGLEPAFEALAARHERLHGLVFKVDVDGSEANLPAARRALLFRLAAELLMNVVKHAGTRQAQLRVELGAAGDRLVVSDEGAGFDPVGLAAPGQAGGMGLASVRDRVAANGGSIDIRSAPGAGCQVTIWLPAVA